MANYSIKKDDKFDTLTVKNLIVTESSTISSQNLIIGPTAQYSTLDSALVKASKSDEGSTIKLQKGTYTFPTTEFPVSWKKGWKNLNIIGDDRQIVGGWWLHDYLGFDAGVIANPCGSSRTVLNLFVDIKEGVPKVGNGSTQLALAGSTVTVSKVADFFFPAVAVNFDEVVAGDIAYWVDQSGNITSHTVASATTNTITFTSPPPVFNPAVNFGVGFCIAPGVQITNNGVITSFNGESNGIGVGTFRIAAKELCIKGIQFNVWSDNSLGVPGAAVLDFISSQGQFGNCMFGPGVVDNAVAANSRPGSAWFAGKWYTPTPSSYVNTGANMCPASSSNSFFFQSFMGENSSAFIESNPFALIVASVWSGCTTGLFARNGGKTCVATSGFYNTTDAINGRGGCQFNVQNATFRDNTTAISLRGNCTTTSDSISVFPLFAPFPQPAAGALPPSFTGNGTDILARLNCYVNIPVVFFNGTADVIGSLTTVASGDSTIEGVSGVANPP